MAAQEAYNFLNFLNVSFQDLQAFHMLISNVSCVVTDIDSTNQTHYLELVLLHMHQQALHLMPIQKILEWETMLCPPVALLNYPKHS